jgi:hypothetical protein
MVRFAFIFFVLNDFYGESKTMAGTVFLPCQNLLHDLYSNPTISLQASGKPVQAGYAGFRICNLYMQFSKRIANPQLLVA